MWMPNKGGFYTDNFFNHYFHEISNTSNLRHYNYGEDRKIWKW